MKEILIHALGICGEHYHPNIINVTFFVIIIFGLLKLIRS